MNRQTKIIGLVVISLVSIFLVIWYVMLPQLGVVLPGLVKDEQPLTLPQSAGSKIQGVEVVNNPINNRVIPEVNLEVTIKSLASSFGERYGSFSNQSDFKNLRDLQPMMTEKFVSETIEYIKKGQEDNDEYYGVTSKTLNTEILEMGEEGRSAEIRLTLQKKEAKESMNQNVKITYEKMIVTVKMENEKWKVDSAVWQ